MEFLEASSGRAGAQLGQDQGGGGAAGSSVLHNSDSSGGASDNRSNSGSSDNSGSSGGASGGWREARSRAIAQAMAALPQVCAVVARDGVYGGGIFAAKDCAEGEILLSIPLSACITSASADSFAQHHPVFSRIGSEESDNYGRGIVALLLVLEAATTARATSGGDKDVYIGREGGALAAATYMRAVAPEFMLRWLAMAGWPEEGTGPGAGSEHPASVVAGTVAWARAQAHQASMQREAASLATAGVQSCQGAEGYAAYRYAQLLLQTRAFKLPTGPVLCPLIDLTNHLSIGANARTKLESGSNSNSGRSDSGETVEDSCLVLRATRALTAGEEVFKNYDPDADYSDIFERYGFLDETSSLHTSECFVPRGSFEHPSDPQEVHTLRARLVAEAKDAGCDDNFQAWWVPDFHVLRCPLVAAARISCVSSTGLQEILSAAASNGGEDMSPNNDREHKDWYLFQSPLPTVSEERAALLKVIALIDAQCQRLKERDCSWVDSLTCCSEPLRALPEEKEDSDSDSDSNSNRATTVKMADSKIKGKNQASSPSLDDECACASEALELALRFAGYEFSLLQGVATSLHNTIALL